MCTISGPAPQKLDLDTNPLTPLVPPPDDKGKEPAKQPVEKPPVKVDTKKDSEPNKTAQDAKAALQGDWIVKSMEIEGQPLPGEVTKAIVLTFQGDRVIFRGKPGEQKPEEGTYTIDPLKSPKQIELKESPAKKPSLGIYELVNDELRMCMRDDASSKGFPTAFATQPNSQLALIVLTRKK